MYEENISELGPLKKFRTKKMVWGDIAEKLNTSFGVPFSATQVENRFKNVMRIEKKRLLNNRTSGNTKISSDFDDDIRRIAAVDDTVDPFLMTQSVVINKPNKPNCRLINECSDTDGQAEDQQPVKKTRKSTPQEELVQLYRESCEERKQRRAEHEREREERRIDREQQRQHRHDEKMTYLKQLIEIFNNHDANRK